MRFVPSLMFVLLVSTLAVAAVENNAHGGEVLYNGIELPDSWPPRPEGFAREQPVTPPYLVAPPKVIAQLTRLSLRRLGISS